MSPITNASHNMKKKKEMSCILGIIYLLTLRRNVSNPAPWGADCNGYDVHLI